MIASIRGHSADGQPTGVLAAAVVCLLAAALPMVRARRLRY